MPHLSGGPLVVIEYLMRPLFVLLLTLGLLLPRTGAALADLMGFQSLVICTGTDLVTLVISPDGTPIEVEIAEHGPCLAATIPMTPDRPVTTVQTLVADHHLGLPSPQPHPLSIQWNGPPPERGPPVSH